MKSKLFKSFVIWSLVLSLFIEATPVWALSKDETIYANLDSNGNVNNVTVTEHLNDNGNKTIVDQSHLNNIKNINGDEEYTENYNKMVWEANGNDIYYEGDTSEELPISMNVKYYLDDEEMSVNDMLGKKGKVRIVLNYKNNLVNTVLVNGKVETLYTPFVVATTSLLSNTDNKNIKVSNGRVIDNGVTSVVVAISSPGLYESLGIKELKNLDTVEISYDTSDFELNSIYSVATSKILEDSDLDLFNNVKDLYSSIGLLQDNMDKLVSASDKLNDGSHKLANGTNELNGAISKIANTYYDYRKMDKNVIKKEIMNLISENMKDIVPVLEEEIIKETKSAINNHKSELEKSLINYSIKNTKEVINGEIERIVNNIDVDKIISDIIGSDLKDALLSDETLKQLATVFRDELNKEIEDEINKTTKKAINGMIDSTTNSMSEEQKKAYIQNISEEYGVSFDQAAGIVSKVQQDTINTVKSSSDEVSKKISKDVINSLNNKEYVSDAIANYLNEVNNRITTIISNDDKLSEYQKELINNISNTIKKELSKDEIIKKYMNASNYVNGLIDTIVEKTAKDLADEYTEDMVNEVVVKMIKKQLSEESVNTELGKIISKYETDIEGKLKIVDSNVSKLQSSVSLLNDGTQQLSQGMDLFNKGIKMYNTEGISKLSKFVNGDIKSLEGKIEALVNLSNNYKTMDDIDSNAFGSSKIIFLIDSVKKEKEKHYNSDKIVEKKTFGDKIKGLFE